METEKQCPKCNKEMKRYDENGKAWYMCECGMTCQPPSL